MWMERAGCGRCFNIVSAADVSEKRKEDDVSGFFTFVLKVKFNFKIGTLLWELFHGVRG